MEVDQNDAQNDQPLQQPEAIAEPVVEQPIEAAPEERINTQHDGDQAPAAEPIGD